MARVYGKALGCVRHCNSLSWLLNSVNVYLREPMSHESENKAAASANSLSYWLTSGAKINTDRTKAPLNFQPMHSDKIGNQSRSRLIYRLTLYFPSPK